MLTKKLLKYKISRGRIIPQFVDPSNTNHLSIASQLLQVFGKSIGLSRAQLAEESKAVIESQDDLIFARGIEKLLLDRTKFDTSASEELFELRHEIFSSASELLRMDSLDVGKFRNSLGTQFDSSPEKLSAKLYGDLPECQRILSFNPLSTERLLHRYNCAQVQGLLIYCENLKITLNNPTPGKSRQLFKYLRFHQLLADIHFKNDNLLIEVDGPLSLFDQTRKYGLNLATFFPGILHQDHWSIAAEVQIKGKRSHSLTVDHKSPLQPYSHQFHSYIPDELSMFQSLFEERVSTWSIKLAEGLIHLNNEHHCFPDFELTHTSGRKMALELFHKWHETHLLTRIKSLETIHPPPLLIGVSSRLTKNPEVLNTLEASNYYSKFGFEFFREMPTVSAVEKLLQHLP
jgi:uncharacterized protein